MLKAFRESDTIEISKDGDTINKIGLSRGNRYNNISDNTIPHWIWSANYHDGVPVYSSMPNGMAEKMLEYVNSKLYGEVR